MQAGKRVAAAPEGGGGLSYRKDQDARKFRMFGLAEGVAGKTSYFRHNGLRDARHEI